MEVYFFFKYCCFLGGKIESNKIMKIYIMVFVVSSFIVGFRYGLLLVFNGIKGSIVLYLLL